MKKIDERSNERKNCVTNIHYFRSNQKKRGKFDQEIIIKIEPKHMK